MATITPVSTASDTAITPAAASGGGDSVAGGSAQRVTLHVINGAGSSMTATLAAVQACNQGVLHNLVVTCAANKTTPIDIPYQYRDSTGACAVTYSSVTTVTVYATTN